MVIDSEGNVLQRTDYYPYGTPFYEPSNTNNSALQQYKYNGKELDVMHGLNTYDYGARQYYPVLPIWDRVDPLAEENYHVTPYMYCHVNPVNRVDPDGCDDYYTTNGDFLFRDDKETDNIIIRNQFLNTLKENGSEWINPDVNIRDASLTAEAYSKIFTDILSKRSDIDMKDIMSGKISVIVWKETDDNIGVAVEDCYNYYSSYAKKNIHASTNKKDKSITAYILPQKEDRLFTTVSNIENMLGVHEYKGHLILGIPENKHWKILKIQKNDSSWEKTTKEFKKLYKELQKEHEYRIP